MSKPTNKNSILVLATLGVYFGLVLVGATPHVLANAAMTREFCITDEVEVKNDLDSKPDDVDAQQHEDRDQLDLAVARSIKRFLSQFRTPAVGPLLPETANTTSESQRSLAGFHASSVSGAIEPHISIRTFLPLSSFARAGIDHSHVVVA